MSGRLAAAWVCGTLLLGLSSADARAQSARPVGAGESAPDSAKRLEAARQHFLLGMQLFEARNHREALREFQLVANSAPSAELWFNMARAHQELGEYDRAARAFERYLRDQVDAKDAGEVRARIAELDRLAAEARSRGVTAPERGSLRIHGRADGALVLLDGQRLPPAQLAEPLLVSAGRHRLDATAPRRVPLHAQIDVAPGLLTAAYVALPPLHYATTEPAEHGASWVLFGLAGAGLVTSIVFAALTVERQTEPSTEAARAWAVRTDVALLGTGVCALAAAVVYLVEARSAHTRLSIARASR